jgi:hypothetical protein
MRHFVKSLRIYGDIYWYSQNEAALLHFGVEHRSLPQVTSFHLLSLLITLLRASLSYCDTGNI